MGGFNEFLEEVVERIEQGEEALAMNNTASHSILISRSLDQLVGDAQNEDFSNTLRNLSERHSYFQLRFVVSGHTNLKCQPVKLITTFKKIDLSELYEIGDDSKIVFRIELVPVHSLQIAGIDLTSLNELDYRRAFDSLKDKSTLTRVDDDSDCMSSVGSSGYLDDW